MVAITTQEFAENVGLALFWGSLVGLERELRARDAGMRTNALVAAGAAIFTMVARLFGDSGPLAGQIITGIGFIGAGNILKAGEHVKGLTTAATLWTVAAVGMVIGSGHVLFGVIGTVGILIVNLLLLPLDHWLIRRRSSPVDDPQAPEPRQ